MDNEFRQKNSTSRKIETNWNHKERKMEIDKLSEWIKEEIPGKYVDMSLS
jgi:uncharacterized protein YgiM (DUF1202 family)